MRLFLMRPNRRSIPACAGETLPPPWRLSAIQVYPRVCGGNYSMTISVSWVSGLSPRVRGKRMSSSASAVRLGSIPACAGETRRVAPGLTPFWVYPRVCGGNPPIPAQLAASPGLSPRVRGKPWPNPLLFHNRGSIPACAGETDTAADAPRARGVYPRVCGGNNASQPIGGVTAGLSPRVRGKPCGRLGPAIRPGSIPACAGETFAGSTKGRVNWVYPRVCGGNHRHQRRPHRFSGLSPRVRGKHYSKPTPRAKSRSIPACAGETESPANWPL